MITNKESDLSRARRRQWKDPGYKKKMKTALRKRWADPEYRRRLSEAHKKRWKDPKLREEMSRKVKAAHTPEVCRRKSRSHKLLFKDPAYSERMHKAWRKKGKDPELRRKKSENSKAMWSRPGFKKRQIQRITEAKARPEVREKHSASAKKMWERRGFRKKLGASHKKNWRDPEYRDRMFHLREVAGSSEKLSEAWTQQRRDELSKKNRDSAQFDLPSIKKEVRKVSPSLRIRCKNYEGYQSKLRIKCRECGTRWSTTWDKFRQVEWVCRTCIPHRFGASEKDVRKIVEEVTGWKFPKTRPEWLRGLELDGYNEKHEVAFEYQGECHYEPIFGENALVDCKLRDERKRLRCLRHGTLLIRIPYWKDGEEVKALAISKLRKAGIRT